MRSAISALLLLCACGNLSNEDVAFLEAIPHRGTLQVSVPAGASGQTACAIGTADVWTGTKPISVSINAGLDGILTLVDAIRGFPPTTRSADARTWGPWPDKNHPGVEFMVTIYRELDAKGVPWRFIYSFAARRRPGPWLPIIEGEFFGAQARDGIGRMVIHFENSSTLAINQPNDPKFPGRFYYDLSGDPRTISLDLTDNPLGFGLVGFDYFWAGYLDGHGRFDYALPPDRNGCRMEITAWFTAAGAGKGSLHIHCPLFVDGFINLCWDQSACITYLDDPFSVMPACGGAKPCKLGNVASCPALP
jgi:hypothetical protein